MTDSYATDSDTSDEPSPADIPELAQDYNEYAEAPADEVMAEDDAELEFV